MTIQLPRDLILPAVFRYPEGVTEEERKKLLEDYLKSLGETLEEIFKKVHYDISLGNSEHEIVSSVPGTGDLEEGQIKIYDNEVDTRRIYTKVNGTVRYAALT